MKSISGNGVKWYLSKKNAINNKGKKMFFVRFSGFLKINAAIII